MWERLSLRGRINLLLALVLTLGLAVNVARLVFEAAPRVQAEDQSVTRLAREFVETIIAGLNEAPDPEARLDQIVSEFKRLRHVSITRHDDGTARDAVGESDDAQSVPAWFVTLVHPEKTSVSVPISIHGKNTALVITSIPNDEIAEIWDGILTQLEVGSAVAVVLFLITMMVIGRALAPLQALSQAMTKIEVRRLRRAGRARRGAGTCSDLHQAQSSGGDTGRGGRGKATAGRARRLAAGSRTQGDRARTAR